MTRRPSQDARFRCAQSARVYEHGESLVVMSSDGALRCFDGDSAVLVRAALDELVEPRAARDLADRLSERLGARVSTAAVEEILELLEQSAAISRVPREPTAGGEPGRIVVALSGGIAAAHAPALVELLQTRGFVVRVAATKSALRFVSRMSLEALTGARVATKLWPAEPTEPVPHLALADWAEVVVIYPTTATTLARLARGDCSKLVSALALATAAPVVLVPAMNSAMLSAPAVRRNLAELRRDGFWLTRPTVGYEVADAPATRKPSFGAAPPVQVVADVVTAVFQTRSSSGASVRS